MNTPFHSPCDTRLPRLPGRLLAAVLLTTCVLILPLAAGGGQSQTTKVSTKTFKSEREQPKVEVHFVDDSTMKLVLLDERLELVTPYGTLLIPTADVVKIEFATRVPEEIAKRIEPAVVDLGHSEYKRRDAASHELLHLGEWAYSALREAAKHSDPEVVRRADELLSKLQQTVPPDRLEIRPQDVVHTADAKNSGRLTATAFKVKTFQFGEQQLCLANVRSLRSLAATKSDWLADALPDPGTLAALQGQVGKTYVFRVTGAGPGNGGVWGTEVYTVDSTLAVAAVHAGILRPGQTGPVRVTILGHVPGFLSSVQNGIQSGQYGAYAGYRVGK